MKTITNALLIPLFSVFIFPLVFISCDPGGGMTDPIDEPVDSTNTPRDTNAGVDLEIYIHITEGMVDDSCFTGLSVQIIDSLSGGNTFNSYYPITWDVTVEPEGLIYIQKWKNEGQYNVRLYNSVGTLIDRGRFQVFASDIENQRDKRTGFTASKSDEPACP